MEPPDAAKISQDPTTVNDKFAGVGQAYVAAGPSLRADFPQVLERVDAAAVAVGPVDPQGVIPDEFGPDRGQRLGVVAGKDRQRSLLLFLRHRIVFLAVEVASAAFALSPSRTSLHWAHGHIARR